MNFPYLILLIFITYVKTHRKIILIIYLYKHLIKKGTDKELYKYNKFSLCESFKNKYK